MGEMLMKIENTVKIMKEIHSDKAITVKIKPKLYKRCSWICI